MPHREELTEQDVLAELARAREPRSLRELAGALRLKHDGRRALAKIVARLKRKGEIEETRQGRYRLAGQRPSGGEKPEPAGGGMKPPLHKTVPGRVASGRGGREKTAQARVPRQGSGQVPVPPGGDANTIRGRLVAHRDGYGFVVPNEPVAGMEGDLFIGRDALGDAMHGDRVLARIERRGRPRHGAAGAAGMGRWEGRIVRVEERAHPTIVGLFRYGSQGNTVLPYDARLLHEIVIPPGEAIQQYEAKVGFYNRTLEASAFSWTGLLVELERSVPPFVSLGEIHPDLATGQVRLRGMARSFDDLSLFLRGLEERTAFRDIYLLHQADRKAMPGGQDGLEFAVNLVYEGRKR